MTVGKWLALATKQLQNARIESAGLDALILLEDATNIDRAHLLAHPDLTIQAQSLATLNTYLDRRKNREPLAYIRGFSEFYNRKFSVNPDVLIPRPESETFLALLAEFNPQNGQKLIDIGTGCGALAISAKLLLPNLQVSASDISLKALRVAKQNAKFLNTNINFFKASLLTKNGPFDYILANLPYVPKNYIVSPEVYAEPKMAVFANDNGLKLIKKLASQAFVYLKPGGFLFIESLLGQQKTIKNYYQKAGFKFVKKAGLVQVFSKV